MASKKIYEEIEKLLNRTLSYRDYEIISNWTDRYKYDEEYLLTCIEYSKNYPNVTSVSYIDKIVYGNYNFYKTLLKFIKPVEKEVVKVEETKVEIEKAVDEKIEDTSGVTSIIENLFGR